MAHPIPANLIEWERVLCARFLRVRPVTTNAMG